jgi:maltodextrin utilization protein YvdJ
MEQQQMNGQIQMQSAQAAEAAKQQTLQVEMQAKMAVIQKEKELELQVELAKMQQLAQIEAMKVEGKINMSKIEANSREYIAQIKKGEKDLGNTEK